MSNLDFADLTPPRILIIDDNPTVHDAFDEILRRHVSNEKLEQDEAFMFGASPHPRIAKSVYHTDHALSGAEGVEKVRAALAAGTPYQVAFVDIRMPGMDGVETIERIWQFDSLLQTIICTAYADYQWEDLTRRLGQTDRLLVLKKPFHDVEVLQLASTLARKWFLARQAALKMEQAELLVAKRTETLLEFQRREHQRIQELDQTKLRYLSQLAQEFRGPLTVILHALEKPATDKSARETTRRNARALLALVDDTLVLRRLEPEDRQLQSGELELVAFLRGLVGMFDTASRERAVQLQFQATVETLLIWTDLAKLEKALFNLLVHSLAACADRHQVLLQLQGADNAVKLHVKVSHVVKNFVPPSDSDLGWLLSRELLRLLGGEVALEPDPRSLNFSIILPATKPPSEIVPEPASESATEIEKNEATSASSHLPADRDVPVILVLEQNADLREFIRQGLGAAYSILEASNAAAGLTLARENVPDLVIVGTDAARHDSLKTCADLKQDEMTSHIPVILLAMDDSDANQVRALEAGVNEFLVKPFRLPLLTARVGNLLENRRKLHEHFKHLQTVQPRELATNQVDAEFLRRVVEIVEKNLADYEFDVDNLARQMAVSRRQLFRKFKALAGCTPNVFIRDIRLKRAAQLLRDSHLTVSEIIYAVGFSDPKYFRTIFRERFGVLPGEYNRPSKPG